MYLQYKWSDVILENGITKILENNDIGDIIEKENSNKIIRDNSLVNRKSEKINEKLFNNSSVMISEIKDNTDKSNYFWKF